MLHLYNTNFSNTACSFLLLILLDLLPLLLLLLLFPSFQIVYILLMTAQPLPHDIKITPTTIKSHSTPPIVKQIRPYPTKSISIPTLFTLFTTQYPHRRLPHP